MQRSSLTVPSSDRSAPIPGPRGFATLGVLAQLRKNPLTALTELTQTYGDIVGFTLGRKRVILVNSPELVAEVFQAPSGTYSRDTYMNSLAKRVLGDKGLIANDGEVWVRQRRMLHPIFRPRQLASYAGIMKEEIQALLDSWESAAQSGATIDIAEGTGRLSLRIASRALFGLNLSPELESTIHEEFLVLNQDLTNRLTSLLPLPPILPTPADRRWRRSMDRLNGAMLFVIRERRSKPQGGHDLLDLLIAARDEDTNTGMDDDEIRDHVKTFMLGGYETTAHALAWSIYLLARHPIHQDRLAAESRLASRATEGFDDLEGLPLARAVFEESMRLYPPGWMTARHAERDHMLGDYAIPRGADVLLCPYTMHRHPNVWSAPLSFDPRRFSGPAAKSRPRYAYFPFGGGPQACIGRVFAQLQGQLMLSSFACRFSVQLADDHIFEPEALLTLRSKHGVRVRLKRRELEHDHLCPPRIIRSRQC